MLTALISVDDQVRIRQFVDVFLKRCSSVAVGPPETMRDGPTDKEGWTPWKAVDSPVGDDEILAIEREFGATFPPLFRAFLMYKCLLMTFFAVQLPETPFNDPFKELRQYLHLLKSDPFFKDRNLVPFGHDSNDAGPVCFDIGRRRGDGDCPIIRVDHDRMRDDSYFGETIAGSFRELLDRFEQKLLSYD